MNRQVKKPKLKQLLQDLLESSSESEQSDVPQSASADEEEDAEEMNTPLANLGVVTTETKNSANSLMALLEKKSSSDNTGPPVHVDLSQLLSTFLTKGLDSETRKLAIEAYPPLENCNALKPPELNAEIKICLTALTLRQDAFLVKLQTQLSAILTALAVPFDSLYQSSKTDHTPTTEKALEKAGDPLKLVADVFHSLSCHRRYLIVPYLDSSIRDVLDACPIDAFLFGEKFPENLKISKEAKRCGATIKKKTPRVSQTTTHSSAQPMAGPSSYTPRFSSHKKSSGTFLASRRPAARARFKQEEEAPRSQSHRRTSRR